MNKLGNSGKFMDNNTEHHVKIWLIMDKFYNDLIIINLYYLGYVTLDIAWPKNMSYLGHMAVISI